MILQNSNLNITAKFREIIGFGCKETTKEFSNFYEAKAYCLSDIGCNWILKRNSNEENFKICSKIDGLMDMKTSSVFAKLENRGTYWIRMVLVSFWDVQRVKE